MKKSLKRIADHYGKDAQAVQAVEELNELACAILQYQKRRYSAEFDNVIEEIADVEIMLEQMKYLYGIGEDFIEQIKQEKIERQMKRMKKDRKSCKWLHNDACVNDESEECADFPSEETCDECELYEGSKDE